jgi:thiosulfate reductase cytochrome b subunit
MLLQPVRIAGGPRRPPAYRHRKETGFMVLHRLRVQTTHRINAAAMVVMTRGGWRITNTTPFLPCNTPDWLTSGNWPGGATAWHGAALWVPAAGLLLCIALATVHLCGRRDQPGSPASTFLLRNFVGRPDRGRSSLPA